MSVYMTEDEQLEAIKKWWNKYQSPIMTLLTVILVAVALYRYWHWHLDKTMQQASITYESMMSMANHHDEKAIQSYANQLIKNHAKTVYASAAHLTLAKMYVENGDKEKAKAQLVSVAHQKRIDALKSIAALRLTRLLIAEKDYKSALQELDKIGTSPYALVIAELRGDVYSSMHEDEKASNAYRLAFKMSQARAQD